MLKNEIEKKIKMDKTMTKITRNPSQEIEIIP
jgi:hypothetical protein